MLTLYYKPACVFCQSVLGEAEALGVQLQLKDIHSDPVYVEELVALGGRNQTPFLIDSESGAKLYESNEIISYFNRLSSQEAPVKIFGGLRIHASEEVCETCQ